MIILASLLAMVAAPASAPATETDSAAPRCALHHLPVPPGKGMISTVMRCTDQKPVNTTKSMSEKSAPTAEVPKPAAGS
ncbi:MAG: hypothetical protein K2P68_06625 [Sphingomonas sp.]|nr:hypothetical protein [Sphingomonas sp.]